jgi:hypothetical protein
MEDPVEHRRRKPGAAGVPVRLADGQLWLLAVPSYRARTEGLTRPPVDRPLDRIFECAVLDEGLDWGELWSAARELLKANYDLSDDELAQLLTVSSAAEGKALAAEVVRALFGPEQGERTYTRWVRASLLANGIGEAEIPAHDLPNVLAVLVATNRAVPLSKFTDACRLLDERARLEALI